jgi:hypothetical protein
MEQNKEMTIKCKDNLVFYLADYFKKSAYNAFNSGKKDEMDAFLNAYNVQEEQDHDGADYLFNFENQKDLECVVRGGMTAYEIATLVNKYNSISSSTTYFLFGANYDKPYLLTRNELLERIAQSASDIVDNMLKYPHSYNRDFYQLIVTNNIVE